MRYIILIESPKIFVKSWINTCRETLRYNEHYRTGRVCIIVYLSSWLRLDGEMRNQRVSYCCAQYNSAKNLVLILISIWSNLYFCRLKWTTICLDQHTSVQCSINLCNITFLSHLLCVSAIIISLLYIYPTVSMISSQLLTLQL